MAFARSSGILLHPTSLPSRYGIGDFGPAAYAFVDWLGAAKQRLWQVLPLGPTGYGDSPYQCFSAFAGNPLLLSPDALVDAGLLAADALDMAAFPPGPVEYGRVIPAKMTLLRQAYEVWRNSGNDADFDRFCEAEQRWLDDYALFMALKERFGGAPWHTWEPSLALREPTALARARDELANAVQFQRFLQYQFARQWSALKRYANERDIKIIGDIPIFVAYDSADVWAQRQIFDLNSDGSLKAMAGVPPDYFSTTGQLWGNPLYRWDELGERGYDWWIDRVASTLRQVDIARIDHFRGFAAYWAVPGGETTAVRGEWRPVPGVKLFEALRNALGDLPIIAEDLGVITDDVIALRDSFNLPGMRIFQFAFTADTATQFLPHNYIPNCVAYPGTHDNDTTAGWFRSCGVDERTRILRYTGTDGSTIHWDMIRMLQVSVADTVIISLQDVLGLGNEARMNLPGTSGGNWRWRFTEQDLAPEITARLAEMAEVYERV